MGRTRSAPRASSGGDTAVPSSDASSDAQRRSAVRLIRLAVVVPDGLDVVAVKVVYERGVVAWPVLGPVARAAVVLRTRSQRCLVERRDLLSIPCLERHMRRHDGVLLRDPEIRVLAVVETGRLAVLHVVAVPERRERLDVELLRFSVIADRKRRMGDHDAHSFEHRLRASVLWHRTPPAGPEPLLHKGGSSIAGFKNAPMRRSAPDTGGSRRA